MVNMKTKANPVCNKCGVELTDDNWYPSCRKGHHYICKSCDNERTMQWQKENPKNVKAIWTRRNRKQGARPFNECKECSDYLGIHIAEEILSQAFKNVVRMPMNNPGFDFKCSNGFLIDVKSSCVRKDGRSKGRWTFQIWHNTIANYFLCLAFDNREDLNPIHVWMIPGSKINHLTKISISLSTIHKWDKYELSNKLNKITTCCNTMKAIHNG